MRKILLLLIVTGLMGCSTTNFDSGKDHLYQLGKTNVVYRDLTKPEAVGNEAQVIDYKPVRLLP
ncbi:TPA: hypothetical protein SMQ11_003827 [Proteus mirabilis]|nr:hypothetical protein [Proteus mirabilis]HEK1946731.1 hypothetical protein [Proteus mirabilis]